MKYISTRGKTAPTSFRECLTQGLAPDGGLFIPEIFPCFDVSIDAMTGGTLAEFATTLLTPFVASSEPDDQLSKSLSQICARAFNFPTPLVFPENSKNVTHGNLAILELFHGPTAAFKDIGARFLAECLSHITKSATIIVATSGDTGGAVSAAFSQTPGTKVIVLYPKGKISPRQEKQLTCWGETVRAFAVNGSFDDCQRIVKEALSEKLLNSLHHFVSANSISVGRLLPQMSYHAFACLEYKRRIGKNPTLIIPTGNLGNAVAALWAKRAGFPIANVILATNANRTIPEYFKSGQYQPGQTITTLANAMDVSAPSNFERLVALYPDPSELHRDVASISISDQEISDTIRRGPINYGQIFCPHTATAVVAYEKLKIENAILVATAHPAKFETIVEPLIGRAIPVPPALAELFARPSLSISIDATLNALTDHL